MCCIVQIFALAAYTEITRVRARSRHGCCFKLWKKKKTRTHAYKDTRRYREASEMTSSDKRRARSLIRRNRALSKFVIARETFRARVQTLLLLLLLGQRRDNRALALR